MRSKADIEDGYWIKLSEDLTQALGRANLNGTEYAICLWVIGHTYGVRVSQMGKLIAKKFTKCSAYNMAQDLGRDDGGVSRSLRMLLSPERNILRKNKAGEIGMNTQISQWSSELVRGREWNLGDNGNGIGPDNCQAQTLTGVRMAKKASHRRDNGANPDGRQAQIKPHPDNCQAQTLTGVRTHYRENMRIEHKKREQISPSPQDQPAKDPKPYKAETATQKVVCAYKVGKKIAWDDRAWDKDNFSRCSKAAAAILRAFDQDVNGAAEFVVEFGEKMDKLGRPWTLETVAKWAWDTKGERAGAGVNQDSGQGGNAR